MLIPANGEDGMFEKTYGINKDDGKLSVCRALHKDRCPYHKPGSHKKYSKEYVQSYNESVAAANSQEQTLSKQSQNPYPNVPIDPMPSTIANEQPQPTGNVDGGHIGYDAPGHITDDVPKPESPYAANDLGGYYEETDPGYYCPPDDDDNDGSMQSVDSLFASLYDSPYGAYLNDPESTRLRNSLIQDEAERYAEKYSSWSQSDDMYFQGMQTDAMEDHEYADFDDGLPDMEIKPHQNVSKEVKKAEEWRKNSVFEDELNKMKKPLVSTVSRTLYENLSWFNEDLGQKSPDIAKVKNFKAKVEDGKDYLTVTLNLAPSPRSKTLLSKDPKNLKTSKDVSTYTEAVEDILSSKLAPSVYRATGFDMHGQRPLAIRSSMENGRVQLDYILKMNKKYTAARRDLVHYDDFDNLQLYGYQNGDDNAHNLIEVLNVQNHYDAGRAGFLKIGDYHDDGLVEVKNSKIDKTIQLQVDAIDVNVFHVSTVDRHGVKNQLGELDFADDNAFEDLDRLLTDGKLTRR